MTDLGAAPVTALSERLGELVRGVRGVETLYPSHSVVAAVTDAAIGTVVRDRERRHPISVVESAGGVTVSAVIGVGSEESASVLCCRVYDAIDAYLTTVGLPIAAIEVRVGSIG